MVYKPFKLSDEQKKKLLALQGDIEAIKYEIARGKRAGLDMKEAEDKYNESLKIRAGILKEYS